MYRTVGMWVKWICWHEHLNMLSGFLCRSCVEVEFECLCSFWTKQDISRMQGIIREVINGKEACQLRWGPVVGYWVHAGDLQLQEDGQLDWVVFKERELCDSAGTWLSSSFGKWCRRWCTKYPHSKLNSSALPLQKMGWDWKTTSLACRLGAKPFIFRGLWLLNVRGVSAFIS